MLENNLREFILKCRELGYLVKLDTNGYRPEILREFLEEKILDYVAMDIKASPENYSRVSGCPEFDMKRIRESIRMLQTSGILYEFRTTTVKGIHTVEEFEEIGKLLAGSKVYYLQAYQDSGDILGIRKSSNQGEKKAIQRVKSDMQEEESNFAEPGSNPVCRSLSAFSKQEMEQMAALAGKYIDKVVLRGVE